MHAKTSVAIQRMLRHGIMNAWAGTSLEFPAYNVAGTPEYKKDDEATALLKRVAVADSD
jgi:hypothetical protein